MLNIHSVESFGTHDGPGIRLVIFAQGCNFRCLYCHNPDTQDVMGGREMPTAEIVEMAERRGNPKGIVRLQDWKAMPKEWAESWLRHDIP